MGADSGPHAFKQGASLTEPSPQQLHHHFHLYDLMSREDYIIHIHFLAIFILFPLVVPAGADDLSPSYILCSQLTSYFPMSSFLASLDHTLPGFPPFQITRDTTMYSQLFVIKANEYHLFLA